MSSNADLVASETIKINDIFMMFTVNVSFSLNILPNCPFINPKHLHSIKFGNNFIIIGMVFVWRINNKRFVWKTVTSRPIVPGLHFSFNRMTTTEYCAVATRQQGSKNVADKIHTSKNIVSRCMKWYIHFKCVGVAVIMINI